MNNRTYTDINGVGLSFRLSPDYVSWFRTREPEWGFGALSEATFLRSYSRTKDARTGTSWPYDTKNLKDLVYGGKERWWEVCERVINGVYSIQKDWMNANNMPWDERKAQDSAMEACWRMFAFKWTPAGRGLWAMGTYLVNGRGDSSPLYNCFFVSTRDIDKDFAEPFCFLMSASMKGGGVGFDTKGNGKVVLQRPKGAIPYRIPDSSEGWVKSVELLLKSYLGNPKPHFDYGAIRPEGEPIITFGGVAPGPEPLQRLHEKLTDILEEVVGWPLASRTIIDIMNLIGVAVVSGNVRRSSEIAFGEFNDDDFWTLKDYTKFENGYRSEFGWMSNNSVKVMHDSTIDFDAWAEKVADGYDQFDRGAGEPGLYFIDNARNYGRMNNGPDFADTDVEGANPCGEIGLESFEACNLTENYVMRHQDVFDFTRTLKFSYLYNKSVSLLPTMWAKTNAVQMRNRRIGVSITGTAHFVDTRGYKELQLWMDEGYKQIREWDRIYSRWLCVRESIKVTTSKPSGTVSLVAGTTAGVHWPTAPHYIRHVTFGKNDSLLKPLLDAGYQADYDSVPGSVLVRFPVKTEGVRPEEEVSVFEKVALVAFVQKWWADNMVSNTINFDPKTEVHDLANAMKLHSSNLKSVSALPRYTESYAYLPEERVYPSWLDEYIGKLAEVDFSSIYDGDIIADDAVRTLGCDSMTCEINLEQEVT